MNDLTIIQFYYQFYHMWDFQFSCNARICISDVNFIEMDGIKL